MSLDKPLSEQIEGSEFRFLIVAACYNRDLVDALLDSLLERLRQAGVTEERAGILRVPGSGEIPYAMQLGLDTGDFDCGVALGVLIRGDTGHFEMIGRSVGDALQMVALNLQTPVINGVIVAENRSQAEARAGGPLERGREFAEAALAMAALKRKREALHAG